MNSTCLCDEKNKHIIMISTGFHEMSFKRYFVKRILKLDPNEIGEKIFNNDDLLNLYLSVKQSYNKVFYTRLSKLSFFTN